MDSENGYLRRVLFSDQATFLCPEIVTLYNVMVCGTCY